MSKRLGNATDPFDTLEAFGPDATRWYMISNANPWDNLKFDLDGIDEIKRKFFGTLYNTYAFFTLYANIDEFNNSEKQIPLKNRPEIDRWIISELNSLINNVDKYYEDYEPTKAARAISFFTQELLSNWYVRLSRRRFWKGEYETDKISAYQTLFNCLITISKLSAPIAPFFMDRMFLDLNNKTNFEEFESVHLSNFPVANKDLINKDLEKKMSQAQIISSLVLSLRAKEKIKVRQPLQKIIIPVYSQKHKQEIIAISSLIKQEVNVKEIEVLEEESEILVKRIKPNFKALGPRFGKDMKLVATAIQQLNSEDIHKIEQKGAIELEINGKSITLNLDDVEISSQDIEGWLVANQGSVTVALDITVSDSLKQEGIARELVNRIQNLRKNSGFEVTDHIDICILDNKNITNAVLNNLDYIKIETLTKKLELVKELDDGIEIDFDGISTKLLVTLNK